jgi:branched-chain amino acid transport system substrate-binding protein
MKKIRFLLLIVLMIGAAFPVMAQDDDMMQMGEWEACATPESLSGEIPVGVTFSLTGGAAVYGNPQLQAVQLAFNEINDSGYLGDATLTAVVEDSGSDVETAIAAVTKLVEEDEVPVIIGPTLSNQALSANPVAMDNDVVVMGVSNTRSDLEIDLGDFYFRNSLPESKVIPGTVSQSVEILGLERVAVMYSDDDEFTVSGYEVFVESLEEAGVEIIAEETFSTADTDFTAQLTNIIAQQPDAIVVSALAAAIVPLLEQARNLGFDGPIIGGNGFNTPGIASAETGAGENANGVIVGGAWNQARQNELSQAFSDSFTEEFGTPPDQFAVQAYTGAWLVATGIRCADSAAPDDIRMALAEIEGFESPLGSFSFDDERLPEHDPVAQIIIDGEYRVLTAEEAEGFFGN